MEFSKIPPRTVEAPSHSAICKMDYSISSPPKIIVIPVEVKSGVNDSSVQDVHSQRLRDKAIRALLDRSDAEIPAICAIQFWAERDVSGEKRIPIDHLLLIINPKKMSIKEKLISKFCRTGRKGSRFSKL